MEYCTTSKPRTIIQKKRNNVNKNFFRKILGPPGDVLWDARLEGIKIF